VGTTFSQFVYNTRCFREDRADALRSWVMLQALGEQLVPFEGTKEELDVVVDYAHGNYLVRRDGVLLTAGSVEGAACVGDVFEGS
jgi:hypothetical protein